ncbi:unnamed protein product [marine sediment metagenome]|uniref:Uncharacterized protein n=1 Tax=marine sediment metagenome TaxID=412755 RepID=X1BBZ6_9ZZZZ
MFPVWELRKKFIEVKKNEREKILNGLNDSYEKFFQKNRGDLSYYLLTCMNLSDKIEKMRTWPWDMRIVITIIGSIIIPIISILLTIIT